MDDTGLFFVGVDGKEYLRLEFLTSFFVGSIGLWFGFDLEFTGGLLLNRDILQDSYKKMISSNFLTDFNVNLYRSCMYLVAFISAYIVTIFRIHTSTKMRIGGWLVIIGTVLSIFGVLNIWLIACGRILFGMGIGIAIQVAVTHPSERARRSRYHGPLMTLFALSIGSGNFVANFWFVVLRIITSETWRVVVLLSSFVLSLAVLACSTESTSKRIKLLFDDSSEVVENYLKTIGPTHYEDARSLIQPVEISPISTVFERKYVPPLVVAIWISIFQQFTGVYAFMIYAPILFKSIGLDEYASVHFSSLMHIVNAVVMAHRPYSTIDKSRRRSLFMQGGIMMLLCQIIITFILRVHENLGAMPRWNATMLAVAMIAYLAGFAWSWGPLGWIVPSEILPLKIQSIGYGLYVSMNMVSLFFVTQFFTMGLRETRFGMHLVILSLMLLMTIFVYVLVPETKGVEVENVSKIWKTHWFWKKFIEEDNKSSEAV